jgi:hypothetical protein
VAGRDKAGGARAKEADSRLCTTRRVYRDFLENRHASLRILLEDEE